MRFELKATWLKKLHKLGGTQFNDYSYMGDDRFVPIDVERCTDNDIVLITKIVQEAKGEPGARAAITKINHYLKVKADPAGAKITRLEPLVAALRFYIEKAPHKWLFCDNDDDQTVPYYVVNIHYTPPDERNGNPAHTSMKLAASSLGSKVEKSLGWNSDDLGKSVVELLNAEGFYLETTEIVKVYEAELAEYRKVCGLTGEQFLATGYAFGGDRYNRSVMAMVRDDAPSKLVMDDGIDDDTNARQRRSDETIVSGSYWMAKPKDGRSKRDDDEEDCAVVIPAHPYLWMFDLMKHSFVSIHVNNIKPYEYDKTLIDKLILPQEHKDLVSMLISGADTRMDDIIKGKTGGIITVSTGPAGTGKTLTAEVFAEEMKRPLYAVACSQLGTDEESLEKELAKVLRRATRWRAILLIDEADVYVHERGNDIQQNAIVGVFLRVLEYYRGVLFMTSNRETVIDDAILSRATAWIKYDYPTPENLARIWRVLSKQYGIVMSDTLVDSLIKSPKLIRPSGRSVKNLLKLVKLLSLKNQKPVDVPMIEYVSKFIKLDHPLESQVHNEKLADAIGQIIFRLETNFLTYQNKSGAISPSVQGIRSDSSDAITADLEKLKVLKSQLLAA